MAPRTKKSEQRRIEYMTVAGVKPALRNAKRHKVDEISESMGTFGVIEVPVIDERTGRLVAGHGRVESFEAAEAEGGPAPEGVVVTDDGEWSFPVVRGWRSRTNAEAHAAGVAVNRIQERGGWDDEELSAIVAETADRYRPSALGFGEQEMDRLLADTAPDEPPPPPSAAPKKPKTKPGDRWSVAGHVVVCGDSLDAANYPTDGNVGAVFTDPPYGVAYHREIANDNLPEDQLLEFLGAVWENVVAAAPGVRVYVTGPSGPFGVTVFARSLLEAQVLQQILVWVKDQFVLGRSDYHYRHELIFYGRTPDGLPDPAVSIDDGYEFVLYGRAPGKAATPKIDTRILDSVWQFDRPAVSKDHPTMKPTDLIEKAIVDSGCARDQIVLDPFGGSGSTAVAAARRSRLSWSIELEPGYVDVILRRLSEATGAEPERMT